VNEPRFQAGNAVFRFRCVRVMKYPVCNRRAVPLGRRIHGVNPFSYQCQHCGAVLRFGVWPWFWFAVMMAVALASIPVIDQFRKSLGIDEPTGRALFGGFMLVWAGSMSVLVWTFGKFSRRVG